MSGDELLAFVLFGIVAAGGVAVVAGTHKNQNRLWGHLAEELGLRYHGSAWWGARRVEGSLKGCAVSVEKMTGAESSSTSVIATVSTRIDRSLRLGLEGGWTTVKKMFGAEDVEVGDATFDDLVAAQGPELILLAALNQDTRSLLEQLIDAGVTLQEGTLRFRGKGDLVEHHGFFGSAITRAELALTVREMVRVMVRFREAQNDIPGALADNAANDSSPAVRRRNFSALVQHFRDSAHAKRAAEALLGEADLLVRVQAAAVLGGEKGKAVLEDIARSDSDSSEARAVAIGLLGDPQGQAALLQVLANGTLGAQVAAAQSLSAIGTIEAVGPLHALAQGLLTPAPLKDASRAAIRAIQSRLGDAEGGRLSLAEQGNAQGALSLAPEGGEVAVAPAPEVKLK